MSTRVARVPGSLDQTYPQERPVISARTLPLGVDPIPRRKFGVPCPPDTTVKGVPYT